MSNYDNLPRFEKMSRSKGSIKINAGPMISGHRSMVPSASKKSLKGSVKK